MASLLGRLVRRAGRAAVGAAGAVGGTVGRTVGKTILRNIPGIGLGVAAFEIAGAMRGRGGGASGMTGIGPGLPMLPSMASMDAGAGQLTGGPMDAFALQAAGKKSFAMPNLTIDQMNSLQAAGLMTQFSELRTFHRSPRKDHVVVHPQLADGRVLTFALHKKLARSWGLWKPSAKPPMSVGMWKAIQRANAAVKVLRRMNSEVKSVANFGTRAKPQLKVFEQPGRKLIGRKAA